MSDIPPRWMFDRLIRFSRERRVVTAEWDAIIDEFAKVTGLPRYKWFLWGTGVFEAVCGVRPTAEDLKWPSVSYWLGRVAGMLATMNDPRPAIVCEDQYEVMP